MTASNEINIIWEQNCYYQCLEEKNVFPKNTVDVAGLIKNKQKRKKATSNNKKNMQAKNARRPSKKLTK